MGTDGAIRDKSCVPYRKTAEFWFSGCGEGQSQRNAFPLHVTSSTGIWNWYFLEVVFNYKIVPMIVPPPDWSERVLCLKDVSASVMQKALDDTDEFMLKESVGCCPWRKLWSPW